jgi:hypothetical protein
MGMAFWNNNKMTKTVTELLTFTDKPNPLTLCCLQLNASPPTLPLMTSPALATNLAGATNKFNTNRSLN